MAAKQTPAKSMLQAKAKEIIEDRHDPINLMTFLSSLSFSDPESLSLFKFLRKSYLNSFTLKLAKLFSGPSLPHRPQAFDLLNRLLTTTHFRLWHKLDSLHRSRLKEIFLDRLRNDPSQDNVQNLHNLLADLASQKVPNDEWDELVEFVMQSLNSNSEAVQESGLFLFSALAKPLSEKFLLKNDVLSQKIAVFMESASIPVRAASVKALVNLILYLGKFSTHELEVKNLSDKLLQIVSFLLGQNHQAHARQVLEDLAELVKGRPGFFKNRIEYIIDYMLKITENQELEDETRLPAVEFVVGLADHKEEGRGMLLKLPKLIMKFVSVLISMLTVMGEDPKWESGEKDDENFGESNVCEFGRKSLGRVARALGGKAIVHNFPPAYTECLSAPEWQFRHAAVTSLAVIAEPCSKWLKQNLDELKSIHTLFKDPNPRVRCAAFNTVKEFSKHLSPEFQDKFHQQVLPALTTALDDFQNPRVQAQAASAMLVFSKNCAPNILVPFLEEIVNKLLKFLQKGKHMLKEVALTALASIAISTQDQFQKYYNSVMPYLKVILMSATHGPNHILLAPSVECITMLWMAVGKAKFNDDPQLVVQALISLEGSKLEKDDKMRCHVLRAWGTLCKFLGQDFSPYMTVAIPRLIQSAQPKIRETTMSTNPDSYSSNDDESAETVNPMEKATACDVLCCCAAELKEHLYLWNDEVAATLLSLVQFDLSEKVRIAAASAMPVILRSSKSAIEKGYLKGFHESSLQKSIIPVLVDALHKESAQERERILDSLIECIQIYGPLLDDYKVEQFLNGITKVLIDGSLGKIEREKKFKAVDIDVGERELLKEENEQVEKFYNKAGDCLVTFIKACKASLSPYFANLLSCITLIWENDKTVKGRRIALRIFHAVAEQLRKDFFSYYKSTLPLLIEDCQNENAEIQEVSVHRIAVCAQFGGSEFRPYVQDVLSSLNALIQSPKALLPDYVMAHDVAVSALGKIFKFYPDSISAAEVVSTWINHLPIRNDIDEAKVVHDQLFSMVQKEDKVLLGPSMSNLPKIVAIFVEILCAGYNLATAETVSRMIHLLKKILIPPSRWTYLMATLPPYQRNLLQSMLSS